MDTIYYMGMSDYKKAFQKLNLLNIPFFNIIDSKVWHIKLINQHVDNIIGAVVI